MMKAMKFGVVALALVGLVGCAGGGKKEMVEFLKGAKEQGFLDGIKIDTSKMVIAVDGAKATAKPMNLEGSFGALTVEFTLEKRDGKWLVTYQAQF